MKQKHYIVVMKSTYTMEAKNVLSNKQYVIYKVLVMATK